MKRALQLVAALALAAVACSHAADHNAAGADAPVADAPLPIDVAPNVNDSMPAGVISFFLSTNCPTGWAAYDPLVGRTVVPQTSDPSTAVGDPLASNEVRTHHHDAPVSVTLGSTSYVGIAGAANTGVAAAGEVDATITTDDGDSGLPYVQLLACKKTAASNGAIVPSGLIAFVDTATCPAGWSDAPSAVVGRVPIALPTDGTPEATFGGAPLTSGEVRAHSHAISGTLALPSHGIALASGCCASGFASDGGGSASVTATSAASAVDLPYLQLRACVSP